MWLKLCLMGADVGHAYCQCEVKSGDSISLRFELSKANSSNRRTSVNRSRVGLSSFSSSRQSSRSSSGGRKSRVDVLIAAVTLPFRRSRSRRFAGTCACRGRSCQFLQFFSTGFGKVPQ